ncbi:MAG TPA: DUF4249 family protein [Chitinophagaceae bacterium]|nr:DUF4249 family protein [Chitinophagaceae bacterium]
MKYFLYVTALLALLILGSCEDVVSVDLNTAAPKLVIDASIDWVKGTDGHVQKIKLSTSTGFYSNEIPTVSGATVQIKNSGNTVFEFVEIPNTGEYVCANFTPVLNESYELTVVCAGQTYTATEKMMPVPAITTIEQENESGLSEDQIKVKFYFQDNGAEVNNYMTAVKTDHIVYPYYGVFDDEFFQGNEIFWSYSHEDLASGDQMNITLYGISKRFQNYMNVLLTASHGMGGPWSTTPSNVKGNLINETDTQNFALGYFRLSEVDKRTYSVQ